MRAIRIAERDPYQHVYLNDDVSAETLYGGEFSGSGHVSFSRGLRSSQTKPLVAFGRHHSSV